MTDEASEKDPFARWFCAVSSPFTFGGYDLGDVYVKDVKRSAVRVAYDPVWDVSLPQRA